MPHAEQYTTAVTASVAHSGLRVGDLVDDTYEIVRLLGRGGMGVVWEAQHRRLPGKRVAIKVLHAEVGADAEALARFRREAEISTRLGHPHIVEVIDINALPDGAPYIVLELLDGEDLASRIARGRFTTDAALTIARQIGSALAAAHRQGVVHRDLKPANVYLCARETDTGVVDHAKVLDFGISKILGSSTMRTHEQRMLGTPQYMSPEQALGKNAQVDQRSDLFALGTIAYEMLAGQPAFVGQTIAEVVFKIVYEPHTPLDSVVSDLPPHVVQAIDRALAKEPSARFPHVGAFIEALTGRELAAGERRTANHARPAVEVGDAVAETIASTPGRSGQSHAPLASARTVSSGQSHAPLASAATVNATPAPALTPAPAAAQAAPAPRAQAAGSRRQALFAGLTALGLIATFTLIVRDGGVSYRANESARSDDPSSAPAPATRAVAPPVAPPVAPLPEPPATAPAPPDPRPENIALPKRAADSRRDRQPPSLPGHAIAGTSTAPTDPGALSKTLPPPPTREESALPGKRSRSRSNDMHWPTAAPAGATAGAAGAEGATTAQHPAHSDPLDKAEAALDRGNAAEADRLALIALRAGADKVRGHFIRLIANCHAKDLAGAKAALEALRDAGAPPAKLRDAHARCRKLGRPLD